MNRVQFNGKEVTPTKIVCVGRNYVDHIKELDNRVPDEPLIFTKHNSSISTEVRVIPGQLIDYEGEISFLVRGGAIVGVGFGLDLTLRDAQQRAKDEGLSWDRAKCFDGSAMFSGFVPFDGDLSALQMDLSVNGEARQQGSYHLMINKPEDLLTEIASFMTMQDNDILMTGTPKGVGPIHVGDRLHGRIHIDDRVLTEKSWVVQGR